MGKRLHTQREWKLLSYWLAEFHSGAEIWMNVRVGPTLPIGGVAVRDEFDVNASRLRNRWADAIFYEGGELNLVEAKIDPWPGVFSEVLHYGRKLRMDPAWARFAATKLNLWAVVGRNDPSVAYEAPFYGVRWVYYRPPWLTEQMREIPWDEEVGTPPELPQDFASRVELLRGS